MIKVTQKSITPKVTGFPVETQQDFEQKIIELARVSRVMKGGKRMRFRAAVAIGNHKGEIGLGIAKATDVGIAIAKAATHAKKQLQKVRIKKGTIPHEIRYKYKAAKVLLKPAGAGHGLKAGGVMRIILELVGIENITAKMLGSANKINNARATLKALALLKDK